MLTYEQVARPIPDGRYKNELAMHIRDMEFNQWEKVGGFEDINQVDGGWRSIRAGGKCVCAELRKQGIKITTRRDKKNLCLYILKTKLPT